MLCVPHKVRCNRGSFFQQSLIQHLSVPGTVLGSPESAQDLCFNWRLIINNVASRREK